MQKQSSHHSFSGHSYSPPMAKPKEKENAWGNFHKADAFDASSVTTLFSSSLPVLPHGKLNMIDKGVTIQSVDDISSRFKNLNPGPEGDDVLEDIETHAIGSLLPDDEEELLAGILDDLDLNGLPTSLEDLEEYDLFSSGGGMELETDAQQNASIGSSRVSLGDGAIGSVVPPYTFSNGNGTVAGEHPYGEHPSRTLFVRNINSNVEDLELRALFEQYGDIRTLYTACKHRGFVMISYYDIRAARTAMRALQNKPLRRRKLDIHFSIPKNNPSEKDINQGTLVAFNLDPSIPNEDLHQIFGVYGEVKEIRETPHKRHHKFIEYYDVRAAEAALKALNRSDIVGKRIKLEPSRPGGARRSLMLQLNQELEQDDFWSFRHQGSPVINSPPASVTGKWMSFNGSIKPSSMGSSSNFPGFTSISPTGGNHLAGLASVLPKVTRSNVKVPPIGKDQHPLYINPLHAFQPSLSFPEPKSRPYNETMPSFRPPTSSGSCVEALSGPQTFCGSQNSYTESSSSSAWSRSYTNLQFLSNGNGHTFPFPGRQTSFFSSTPTALSHHVGSAPSGVPSERHFGYFPQSPDTSLMGPGAFRGLSFSSHAPVNPAITTPRNMSEIHPSTFQMMSSSMLNSMLSGSVPYLGLLPNTLDGLNERGRSRWIENNGNQIDSKKQFQLDLDKIKGGEDTRTTLMIKNIPNKYTSKMLLAAIDEHHKGTYDFLYLPIDFKNKCNVGYAFINMLSPQHIISFYEAFDGKRWEKFNSEKVASLAYARIQGKMALMSHFQNSSLMNEDKRCRPILFHSDGPEAGNQILHEHLPSSHLGINIWAMNDSSGSPPSNGISEGLDKF
ncbi:protein MEI2-like 5 isoform X1 [Cucurbita pepo subsp. pepo]|uniref:protein MEI2-like 5 isoform X1 n=1 Tax=Cucurbita pepo subsp. pepo TaxID=3664 RepID=UPI000C9D5D42|nr:protein MEI2-like 5 isoform X1 [Cucurbita pepo subsp. pepo]XP_023543809.1 protein MEI2-like 5 isoform X1 [Cucurbita pepo subsp. pepo]